MADPESKKSYHLTDITIIVAASLGFSVVILVLVIYGWDSLQAAARDSFQQNITNRLEKEIDTKIFQMYPEYAEKLARNKEVIMLAQGQTAPSNSQAIITLETAKQIAGGARVYVLNHLGIVVGSSSVKQGKPIVGNDYSFRPYFSQAIRGENMAYPALGVTSGTRGIYFSAPIYSEAAHPPVGVVVIKAGLEPVDKLLDQITEPVALLSPDGIIFASNREDWMFRAALPIKEQVLDSVRKSRQFADQSLAPLETSLHGTTAEIEGIEYSIRWLPIMIRGWQLGSLASLKINYTIPTQQLIVFWGGFVFLVILSANSVVMMFNISKRKVIERELRQTEEKYRGIFENAVEGIFRTSLTRQFVDANDSLSRILGFDSKEELILSINDIAKQCFVDATDFYNIESRVAKEGKISGVEKRLVRKRGQWFWGSLSLRAVKDASGKLIFYEGTLFDISERKDKEKAERQKEIAELSAVAKDEFLANMSHEIRTPMNAILGLCQLMNKTELSPKQSDYQKKIYSSANSLLRLINDILDLSKIEAGGMVIESIPFRFDEIFENLSIITATRIGDSPVEFLYDFRANIPRELEGDPYRIGQILTNLVSNAVKFTEEGSIVVRVSVKEAGETKIWLRFVVEDTGIGIHPEKQKILFDPFTQADGSTTRKYGGTGLGLSICQKLCTLMGGSIGVDSELGKGSLFYFELPLGVVTKSQVITAPHPELQDLKVLLVDDSPVARDVLSMMLKSMGFEVDIAGSESQALVRLKEPDCYFDLVLLDWCTAGIDGCETARRIHEECDEQRRPIVIMMVAYGHEMMEQEIDHRYLDGLLVKPATPFLMFDTIARAFESRTLDKPSFVALVAQQPLKTRLRGKILLVEDNEINQLVAKELLEQMGLVVDTVDDGEKSIRYVEQQRPDLVLMDIQMPVMDGYEATRQIRALPGMSDLPIIAMTANALVSDVDISIEAGMDGHIAKPVNQEELYHILSEYVS
jgi:PAS domain S-box-containing protein